MIEPETKKILVECARKYGAKTVWLFGSALRDETSAADIDIGVEGLNREKAWEMYSELFDRIHAERGKTLDFVEMDEPLSIIHVIRAEGVKIYDVAS